MNMMKDINVVYTDTGIHFEGAPSHQIMMFWEDPLMEEHAKHLTKATSGSHEILELGYGLGLSAQHIYNLHKDLPGYRHTIYEIHHTIAEEARKWASDKPQIRHILYRIFFTVHLHRCRSTRLFLLSKEDNSLSVLHKKLLITFFNKVCIYRIFWLILLYQLFNTCVQLFRLTENSSLTIVRENVRGAMMASNTSSQKLARPVMVKRGS